METPITRLASYNIRKTRGLDQRRDPGRIIDVLNGLDADIVALQEADLRLAPRIAALPRDLIERETDFKVVDVADNDVSLGWHGNAILARPSFQVRTIRPMHLPGFEPRGAVAVDFDNGFSVIGAHLGLMRRHRQKQLNALQELAKPAEHCAILGDFNEWSAEKGFDPLLQSFDIHAPGLSFHARRPVAALDRIALSPGLTLKDAGVEEGRLARRASDHLPIWADISLT
ncbi:MAG: endonuclease/exonuclease/phosphatase family protein [Arenibacterium sp.]